MELIGDLERLVAQNLYPMRTPLAIGFGLLAAGTLVLARRRRWDRVVRRYPRASAALLVLALAVGTPLGWYLGSPLILRTELIEASGGDAVAVRTIAAGEVRGADDFHTGSGRASIVETASGDFALRLEDFSVRNGPALYVYLSPDPDGFAEGALELGTLKATDGSFGYELPAGTDPAAFRSAVIWCKQFAVLFAVAPLSAP